MSLASTIMNYLRLRNLFFPISYASLFFKITYSSAISCKIFDILFTLYDFKFQFQNANCLKLVKQRLLLCHNILVTIFTFHIFVFQCYDTCISIICNMQYLNLCYINKQFFNVLLLFILLLALCFSYIINEYLIYGQFSPVVCQDIMTDQEFLIIHWSLNL